VVVTEIEVGPNPSLVHGRGHTVENDATAIATETAAALDQNLDRDLIRETEIVGRAGGAVAVAAVAAALAVMPATTPVSTFETYTRVPNTRICANCAKNTATSKTCTFQRIITPENRASSLTFNSWTPAMPPTPFVACATT